MAVKENNEEHLDDNLRELEKEAKEGKSFNCETINNSAESKVDTLVANGEGFKLANTVTPTKNMNVHPRPLPEGVDDKSTEDLKEVDLVDEGSSHSLSVTSDDERGNADEIDEHDEADMDKKIEEMETRIEKLEQELREVAALEISLYSVVPEHGSSAHKLHTPARRLSRLYIHACKQWTQNRRATIARNTVSGLVMIAKSCGNDVPRLTFWLSNTVVLREIIFQTFGNSSRSSPVTRVEESNRSIKRNEGKPSSLKWKVAPVNKQVNKPGFVPFVEDWQETRTFTNALEKVESWIFSRLVESVWWQTITPNMQSPAEDTNGNNSMGKLSGPSLGDQQQRSFSIDLWKKAFQDASQRLCPVRAGGHECGCLPVLARSVMKQCVARLDVAMFNAILRESAHEIPTDPISDPILDSKVLPIPAGDLSFGSGAQLKNSIGYWTRWLTDMFGMDSVDSRGQNGIDEKNDSSGEESNPFLLLNALSDLLMLPKDMLIDVSIRKEICPSIGLPLIKRILCNFTPDEFCPDAVPGAVLEALNAESIIERRLSGDSTNSFPCPAAPVMYIPPSRIDIAVKIAETGARSQMERSASIVQKKGYTSDEELEELNAPPFCFTENSPSASSTSILNVNGTHNAHSTPTSDANLRYELLREVWSA